MGEGHDTQVTEATIRGSAFTIDTAIAKLEDEGITVVRTSPYVALRSGAYTPQGEHKLVFPTEHRVRVAQAMHEAGVL